MGIKHVAGLGVLALVGYDTVVRRRLLDWGSTPDERSRPLPGDEIVTDVVPAAMGRHTRAVTIDVPPEAIWPWLVQIGDRRAGFYSYGLVRAGNRDGALHRGQAFRRSHPS